MLVFSWLFAIALALAAQKPAEVPVDAPPVQIMALPAELREQFAGRVLAGRSTRRERLERMVDFVFDANSLGMRYDEGATHTVEQAFATRRANCLGFTLLFLALAREAGLEAQPLVIEETLSWHREGGIVFRNSHVFAEIRIGPRKFTLDVARDAVITRGRPLPLTERHLRAQYHNNLAMELLERKEFAAARQQMTMALELDPTKASLWSNAGVLDLRSGDAAGARRAYDEALRLQPENANALFNAVSMASRDGNREREAELRARLKRVQEKDPFHHFLLAIDLERAGDFVPAIAHYQRAIRLHRGDHRFHAALAGAAQRLGNIQLAREALQRAISLSDGETRAAYRVRMDALQR